MPIYEHDDHHAPSLLFGQRCRDCFWYFLPVRGMYIFTDPVLRVTDAIITSTAVQQYNTASSSATGSTSTSTTSTTSQCDFHSQPGEHHQQYYYYMLTIQQEERQKKIVVDPRAAAAAAAARPPQPIEHHAHSVFCGAKVVLPALVIHNKTSRTASKSSN